MTMLLDARKRHACRETGSHSCLAVSRQSRVGAMEPNKCTSVSIGVAILLDVVGVLQLLIGIFAPLPYWDFFVLSGPVVIFLSIFLWIFWYLGNLKVSEEELNIRRPDIL